MRQRASTANATQVAVSAGSGQSTTVGQVFANALAAKVTDASGNPVGGVQVTFTAPSSGSSGSFAGGTSIAVATTDTSGIATAPALTANDVAGSFTVSASASGATPASFQLTNLAASGGSGGAGGGSGGTGGATGGYIAPAPTVSSVPAPTVSGVSPSFGSAAGGTRVTITGSGFVSPATVDFGPNTATDVAVVSGSQITAISPPGDGTVDVTVAASTGTSARGGADQFSYRLTGAKAPTFQARG